MGLLIDSRSDFTLDNFLHVAWQGESVSLSQQCKQQIKSCRAAFLDLLDSDPDITIYGVTTGYGQNAKIRLAREERQVHAARPLHAIMVSFGEPLAERVTRGIVFARLANFVEGHAAVSTELAEAVVGLLDKPLPAVPTLGNGSAGEIVPLSHLFGPLTEKLTLAEKERLALVNGSPCASALIADAVLAAKRRLDLALEIFALAADALKAPLEQFDSALDELWCDPHEAAVLQKMRYWLKDADQDRRSYQAPVSWRIVPRVAAQAHRTVAQAEGVASSSLRSVSDNPVFLPPNESRSLGRVLSNGGFHNAKAYPALDNLSACWADLALLCDRQITKLLDDNISLLPHQLMQGDGYVGCMGFGAADYAERARGCAQRTLLPGSEGGGFGQNDVAVPTFSASLKQAEAGRCLEACLAMLAAISSQAFFITERKAPPRLAALLEEIRDSFSPVTEARALGPDTERLAGKFTARVFAPSLA